MMETFSNSLLHLTLSSSVKFIVPHDQRPLVPSDPLKEDTEISDLSRDFQDFHQRIDRLADLGAGSWCPHSTRCIMLSFFGRLLQILWFPFIRGGLDAWFRAFAKAQMDFKKELSRIDLNHFKDEMPMITGLLACAVQAHGKLDMWEAQTTRLRWTWYVLDKFHSFYRARDKPRAVDFALEVFPAVDSPSRPLDSVSLMLLEQTCEMLLAEGVRSEHIRSIAKNAMDLFQKIIHGETRGPLSKLEVKDLVARCIDVLVECFAKMMQRFLTTGFADFVSDLSRELVACLSAAEKIVTTKTGVFDVSVFLNFSRVCGALVSPAKLASYGPKNLDLSGYNSAHDELNTYFTRLKSALLAIHGIADLVVGNPADPLPVQKINREGESKAS